MLLLPFERITVESSQSADELIATLTRLTMRPPPISDIRLIRIRPKYTATFVGDVSKDRLHFRRVFRHRNSFAPFVTGRIVESPFGSRIDAILRPHPFVLAFIAVWVSFIGPGAVHSAWQFFRQGTLQGLQWVPLVMLVGMYVACMAGFAPESRRMKQILRELAGAPPITLENPHGLVP